MRSFIPFALIIILQACQGAAPHLTANQPEQSPGETKPARTVTTAETFQSNGINRHNGGQTTYHERYVNEGYGYSVEIPKGLIGTGSSSPAPNHGISITLSEQPEARIWTDGSFNSQFWSTLDEAAAAHVEGSKDEASQVEVVRRSATHLHDLTATRITLRRKDSGSSEAIIEDVILALRDTKGEVGIVYTVSLITTEARYNQDKEVFNQVLHSWRARKLLE